MLVVIGCFLLTLTNFNPLFAEDTKPVQELKKLYNKDKNFQKLIDNALKNLHPQPDGSPNPWKGKNFDDLCQYFNQWYYFIPGPGQGLDYIQCFSWVYYKNDYGMQIVSKSPGKEWIQFFVKEKGKYMDTSSKAADKVIKQWMEDPSTHIDEFIIPQGGFKTFNQFFIRTLKPGVRPIADPTDDSVLVSPADALVNMIDNQLTLEKKLHIKHNLYLNVKQLLDNSKYAAHFENGTAVSCILMPNIYHHYHAPITGQVVESNENVQGQYFGIEDFPGFFHGGDVGYEAPYNYFEHFRRGYLVIKTKKYGYVGMVPVGLNTISSVVFKEPYKHIQPGANPVPIYKGEEVGFFQYGGSLVILLFEPGVYSSVRILMGARMGTLNEVGKESPTFNCPPVKK